MKYFIDTEFIEGTQVSKCPFRYITGKRITKPTIDLISIGIVCEDGREYYAISKDFNLKEAWNRYDLVKDGFRDCGMTPIYKKVYWIRENVLKPIFIELRAKEVEEYNIVKRINVILDYPEYSFCFREFKRLIKKYGKTNKQIAEEVLEFVYNFAVTGYPKENTDKIVPKDIEFYGYYSDYDWVVFCWLFGKMIDLPKGFPMYCKDLKQELDNKALKSAKSICNQMDSPLQIEVLNNCLDTIKSQPNYPKQTNEHNALQDAHFNYNLYKFLEKL